MKKLIFVVDPMCSWSWGFHPIIEELRANYSDEYEFSLVMGGLRTTGDMEWNRKSKDYLQNNWEAVNKKTGQLFSAKILIKDSFNYDTYPACKALITVRKLWGEKASFSYLGKIQKAFYTKGEDITDVSILSNYVENKKDFLDFYESEEAETLMKHDFAKAKSMGANSFPSVVKIDTDGHMLCLKGYKTIEEILQ